MVHPYPPLCPSFDYIGVVSSFVTFKTYDRQPLFRDATAVALVTSHIQRAANERALEILVYCFMPDHLHLVVRGTLQTSNGKDFFKLAKQYSGYCFARERGRQRLWQRYGHDRIIRDLAELLDRIRYVVNSPVRARLVQRPEDYPFWGSCRWGREDVLKICDGSLSTSKLLELLGSHTNIVAD